MACTLQGDHAHGQFWSQLAVVGQHSSLYPSCLVSLPSLRTVRTGIYMVVVIQTVPSLCLIGSAATTEVAVWCRVLTFPTS